MVGGASESNHRLISRDYVISVTSCLIGIFSRGRWWNRHLYATFIAHLYLSVAVLRPLGIDDLRHKSCGRTWEPKVIPEHRTAAWEVMSDDGQGIAVWQHQALFEPSWPTGSGGARTGVTRGDNAYNGFQPMAPVFIPEQVRRVPRESLVYLLRVALTPRRGGLDASNIYINWKK